MSIVSNSCLESLDGDHMHVEVSIVVVQMVLQSHDSVSQSVLDSVPVVDSVRPDGISCSVGSNSNSQVVDSNSVSVESDVVSLVRNSVGGNHVFFVSDGGLKLGNLGLIDVSSLELDLQRMSQSMHDVAVLNNQLLEVVNSVDVNLDGSSVHGDLMSERNNFCSVSVDNSSMGHHFLVLIFTIQLSGLRNRGES